MWSPDIDNHIHNAIFRFIWECIRYTSFDYFNWTKTPTFTCSNSVASFSVAASPKHLPFSSHHLPSAQGPSLCRTPLLSNGGFWMLFQHWIFSSVHYLKVERLLVFQLKLRNSLEFGPVPEQRASCQEKYKKRRQNCKFCVMSLLITSVFTNTYYQEYQSIDRIQVKNTLPMPTLRLPLPIARVRNWQLAHPVLADSTV